MSVAAFGTSLRSRLRFTYKGPVTLLLSAGVVVFFFNAILLIERHSAVTTDIKAAEHSGDTVTFQYTEHLPLQAFLEETTLLNRIEKLCSEMAVPGSAEKVLVHEPSNTSFCIPPGLATRSWVRVIELLNEDSSGTRFHQSPPLSKFENTVVNFSVTPIADFQQEKTRQRVMASYRVLLASNPYDHLWNIYVNKFILIDSLFWTHYAPEIRENYLRRHNRTVDFGKERLLSLFNITSSKTNQLQNASCPDISFEEFLSYAIVSGVASKEPLGSSLRPLHYTCNPCQFKPHFISKMDTEASDYDILVKRLGFRAFNTGQLLDLDLVQEIKTKISLAFQTVVGEQQNRHCIDEIQLEKRLILAFILNGYIPENSMAPLIKDLPMGQTNLTSRLLYIYSQSKRSESDIRRQQRYFRQISYKNISRDTLSELKELYKLDFLLFGYSPDPMAPSG